MSDGAPTLTGRLAPPALRELEPLPAAILACAVVLTGSYLSVLYGAVGVVGGTSAFGALVLGALVLAAVVARLVTPRQATAIAVVLLAAGLGGYLLVVPRAFIAALSVGRLAGDTLALLTGFSILGMTKVGTWALSVTPGPVFLSWYFALREEYGASAAVGGLTLGFFVLTGDAGSTVTLLGVLAAAGMVGFGTVARHGGSRRQVETLAVAFALMILASATVSAVPGGGESPIVPARQTSIETELISADEQVGVGGSIRLSPKVRFTVTADRAAYWRVGAYDRYTGSGWVRTGQSSLYGGGTIRQPPGPTRLNRQTVEMRAPTNVLPAANQPVSISGIDALVTELGGLQPTETLTEGEQYSVLSRAPRVTPERLQGTGTDYPDRVEERYLQVPGSTPDRVARFTRNVTAGADTPYETAVAIERWLEANKEYSLSVRRPTGDIADSFLFEMEAGYCTYYATTMVTMLRTQGVPARFVVGYTPGQRVDENEWVVRGLDSHAWVEVYFPDVGWVKFDPTPGDPRSGAEDERVTAAREAGVEGVDAAGSENGTWTPTPTEDGPAGGTGNNTIAPAFAPGLGGGGLGNGTGLEGDAAGGNVRAEDPATGGGGDGDRPVHLPRPETVALWAILGAGVVVVGRRTGVVDRLYRQAWLRWEPRGDARQQVAGAYERVEYLLAREHRDRRPGETVREYLDAVDADRRSRRVAEIRERARYAGSVSAGAAVEARTLAGELARDGGRGGDNV